MTRSNRQANITIIFAVVLFICAGSVFAQAQNPALAVQELDFSVRESIDVSGNKYIGYAGQLPSLLTFVNPDGSVSVCVSNQRARETFVYEYSKDLKLAKTIKLKNELSILGAFTKDSDGNYYCFFAESAGKSAENMAMVKYDKDGTGVNAYRLAAHAPNSMDGVKGPFDAGTCRLELSGSMLAVYFARLMFNGHQASYGFVLDKDSFERIDNGATTNDKEAPRKVMPYVSHSFNQFIVPVENGFVFADHGDAYPRGFTFAKFQTNDRTKRVKAFTFPGSAGQNATYAEMGGLAKTEAGYIFAGTFGKGSSNPRNVFVLSVDENMESCGEPVYLTSYTKADGHAGHPKLAALEGNRYLILWELFEFSTQSANAIVGDATGYKAAYMLIVDDTGGKLSEITQLPSGIRLNMNDTLRYNKSSNSVCWAVNAGGKGFALWSLNPDKPANATVDASIFNKPAVAEAEDFKFTIKGKKGEAQSVTITKYSGHINNLIIPDAINGIPVTVIGKESFTRAGIATLVIPSTVKVIEDQAFWYSSISELVIPEGVESIGKQAFSFCGSLTKVTLPKSLKTVREFAFMGCPNLVSVTIHEDSDLRLGQGAFDKCPKLDAASKDVISRF